MKKTPPLKLNLGCGLDRREGWVNIDALPELDPDLVHDLSAPLPFNNGSVSEVLAQDILEHFTKEDVQFVISEIARVLRVKGTVHVRVPNVDDIIKRFAHDHEVRNQFLYGTTAYTHIFGAHKVGFTPLLLTTLMLEHGLQLEVLKRETTNWVAQFSKLSARPQLTSVTYINQSLSMGGAETFMCDLLTQLHQQGLRVRVHTTSTEFARLLKKSGIQSYVVSVVTDLVGNWKGLVKTVFFLPQALWQYKRIFNQEKSTDLIVFSGFSEKIIGSVYSRLWKRPIVWIEFGPLQSLFKKFFYLPKLLYYAVKSTPNKVIVPSHHSMQQLISHAHLSLAKLEKIPCGRRDVSKQLLVVAAKHEALRVVCVSRLEQGKGQDLLIQAFATVHKRLPGAELVIVGEGDFGVQLKKQVHTLQLDKVVKFTGKVVDPLEHMATASVCVFPSVWQLEGFGLVNIEAMALAKPVVAFDHGPGNEVVVHGQTGLLAQTGSVSDLAEKLLQLLTNHALRKKLGTAARKRFLKYFTIEQCAFSYKKHLEKAFIQHQARQLLEMRNK